MKHLLSYYIVPNSAYYVQHIDTIRTWEKVENIDHSKVTCVVIEEADARWGKFYLVYNGKIQSQQGGSACVNPHSTDSWHRNYEYDSRLCSIKTYSFLFLLQRCIAAKYELLKKLGINTNRFYDEDAHTNLPYSYNTMEGYTTNPGLLLGQLDLIGMGKCTPGIVKESKQPHKKQLLLN